MRKRLLILPLALLAGTASVATAQVVNNDHDRGPLAGAGDRSHLWPGAENVVRTQSTQRLDELDSPDPSSRARS